MSFYSSHIRVAVSCLVIVASMATIAVGADPKVARISHEVAVDAPREINDTKSDDMSYSPQWPEPPNTGGILLRLCIGTVVVVALSVGTLWFGKPWLQRLQVTGAGNKNFYIEGSVAVGNRGMLYLVRVGGTQLVAGTDASGLKSLITIPASFKDVLDEQIPDSDAPVVASPQNFDGRMVRSDSKE